MIDGGGREDQVERYGSDRFEDDVWSRFSKWLSKAGSCSGVDEAFMAFTYLNRCDLRLV